MSSELEKQRDEAQEPEQRIEGSSLSRRRFLAVFGIGAGAALLLGTGQAEALVTPSPELAADGLAGAKEEKAGEGDSDDPVERTQYWRRRRRRYWRRGRRRYWRGRRTILSPASPGLPPRPSPALLIW